MLWEIKKNSWNEVCKEVCHGFVFQPVFRERAPKIYLLQHITCWFPQNISTEISVPFLLICFSGTHLKVKWTTKVFEIIDMESWKNLKNIIHFSFDQVDNFFITTTGKKQTVPSLSSIRYYEIGMKKLCCLMKLTECLLWKLITWRCRHHLLQFHMVQKIEAKIIILALFYYYIRFFSISLLFYTSVLPLITNQFLHTWTTEGIRFTQ